MVGGSNVVAMTPRARGRALPPDLLAWRAGKQEILLSLQDAIISLKTNPALFSSEAAAVVLQELSYVQAAFSALDLDGELAPEKLEVIAGHLNELHDTLQSAGERLLLVQANPGICLKPVGSGGAHAAHP